MVMADDMQVLNMFGLDMEPFSDFIEADFVLGRYPCIAGQIQQELMALHYASGNEVSRG